MISSGGNNNGKGTSQDFDLNLAPIIDCITVLIAFILISTSFISIGLLDAGVATETAHQDESKKKPEIDLTLEILENKTLSVKLTGKKTKNITVESADGEINLIKLSETLAELKSEFQNTQSLTITAQNSIAYKEVVKTMEASSKHFPGVILGGL